MLHEVPSSQQLHICPATLPPNVFTTPCLPFSTWNFLRSLQNKCREPERHLFPLKAFCWQQEIILVFFQGWAITLVYNNLLSVIHCSYIPSSDTSRPNHKQVGAPSRSLLALTPPYSPAMGSHHFSGHCCCWPQLSSCCHLLVTTRLPATAPQNSLGSERRFKLYMEFPWHAMASCITLCSWCSVSLQRMILPMSSGN